MSKISFDIANLLHLYRAGKLRPAELVEDVLTRVADGAQRNAWIYVLSKDELRPYVERLEKMNPESLPLYGIPFAVKDNIDLAGVPTTAACPDYQYVPKHSATVVDRLIQAGAIPIGKTNLDQFATGLVGTRSPHGPGKNVFDSDFISGGSSSGSAIAVAAGEVSFSLGTDTAGSGRVPAAFNNLVGLKPTRGRLSTNGVVPACRSLDCVSVFGLCMDDARHVLDVAGAYDEADPFSRLAPDRTTHFIPEEGFRFGVPAADQLSFFGDMVYTSLYEQAVDRLQSMGGVPVRIDLGPFLEAARLLYEGPWVAERYAAIGEFLEKARNAFHPVTRSIIESANQASAVDTFKGQYRLAELKRIADQVWAEVDVMVTPTAGTIYRIAELDADPIRLNANLGFYTNFMNLLDYAAVAVPSGFREDGLPFGVTLFGPGFTDDVLLSFADRFQRLSVTSMGATGRGIPPKSLPEPESGPMMSLAVCGAHMAGLPLNHQIIERNGRLLRRTRTAPNYRLVALPGGPPHRPGLLRVSRGGHPVEVEIWEMPSERFGDFLAGVPAPLGIGQVMLSDGSSVPGFLCEAHAADGAEDISQFGGWRDFLRQRGFS